MFVARGRRTYSTPGAYIIINDFIVYLRAETLAQREAGKRRRDQRADRSYESALPVGSKAPSSLIVGQSFDSSAAMQAVCLRCNTLQGPQYPQRERNEK
jgi:hypothetical protein